MVCFIEKMYKPNYFEKMFSIIRIEKDRILLPTIENKNISNKKLIKILKKNNVTKVVLSKDVEENKELKKLLKISKIHIYDGRWMFKYIVYEIIKYILDVKNIKKEETELTILTNETSDTSIENIKIFAKEFKRVNIVTNHIDKFKKIEKDLYNKEGIAITVTNNKKKSLSKSDIILNIDFPNELINKFQIKENSIIINPEGGIKIESKRFNGTIVNDYKISLSRIEEIEYEKVNNYELNKILETLIYKKDNFYNIRRNIKKYGMKIERLIGNNGYLTL